jgi:hypothetical protein
MFDVTMRAGTAAIGTHRSKWPMVFLNVLMCQACIILANLSERGRIANRQTTTGHLVVSSPEAHSTAIPVAPIGNIS